MWMGCIQVIKERKRGFQRRAGAEENIASLVECRYVLERYFCDLWYTALCLYFHDEFEVLL